MEEIKKTREDGLDRTLFALWMRAFLALASGVQKPLFISYAISGTEEFQLLGEILSTLSVQADTNKIAKDDILFA